MKRPLLYVTFFGCLATTAPAQVLLNYSWSTFNQDTFLSIPDANATGISDIRTIVADALQILDIAINIEASGNYNGDLYVTLQHGSGFSVLLNRPGRTTGNSFGYADKGFSLTLSDSASNGDIHTYRTVVTPASGAPLTGIWQPDGRLADPSASLVSSPRTALLGSFQGQNPDGDWTLFAADLSPGGQTKIISWGIQVTVVPEPRETAQFTVISLLCLASLKKICSRRLNGPIKSIIQLVFRLDASTVAHSPSD